MQRMFEDGTCRVKPNYYTRTIQYQDINYQLAQQEDKTAIFDPVLQPRFIPIFGVLDASALRFFC